MDKNKYVTIPNNFISAICSCFCYLTKSKNVEIDDVVGPGLSSVTYFGV